MSGSTCCVTRPTPKRSSAALRRAGAVPVSDAVADCVRVEHGRPRYGVDLDDSVIPQEAGLNERAVSFSKGCYVGQETVARLYYRGKPNRQLRGLRLAVAAAGRRRDRLRRADRRTDHQRRAVAHPGTGRARARAARGTTRVRGDRRLTRSARSSSSSRSRADASARNVRSATGSGAGLSASWGASGCAASHEPRILSSSISSGGTCAPTSCDPAAAGSRGRGPSLDLIEIAAAQRPPVDKPSARDPEAVEVVLGRVRRQHQARPGVGCLEHASEAAEDGAQTPQPPAQRCRALEPLRAGRRLHLAFDVIEQRTAGAIRGVLGHEQPQRLVQPAAVEIGIEVAQARRQATAHLAVGRRVLAPGQPAAAVAQAEQRVELLHELERRPPAADRPDRDRVPGGRLGRDLEDRIGDVEPAADVDQPIVAPRQPLVARRRELLDQAVLEHQRPELRPGRAVVDDRGVRGPLRGRSRRGEMRPRTAADRDRLADVQDLARVVAEQVHARIARQVGELRRRRRLSVPRAAVGDEQAVAGARREARVAGGGGARPPSGPRRRSTRWRTGAAAARTAPARTSRRRRAPGAPGGPRSRARRRARSGRAGAGAAASRARAPPCRSPVGWATRAPRAQTPGAGRDDRKTRCGPPSPVRCSRSASGGSTDSSDGAPSTIAWVIPVKRWIPRRSGALVRTSELQRSCSSPPPTSTAPISVTSQLSPLSPLVSVSTTMNSAVAIGACSSSISTLIRHTIGRRAASLASPTPKMIDGAAFLTAERGSIVGATREGACDAGRT